MVRKPPVSPDPFDAIADALAIDETELQSLREQAALDPIPGCPLTLLDQRGLPTGELLEPGDWADHVDRRTGLPPNCPILPLGFDGQTFYFLNTVGQVAVLDAKSSGKGPIDALFAGRSAYLQWAWPRKTQIKDTASYTVKGYEAEQARIALFDACAFTGSFDDMERVRGRGAWTDAAGRLIYHAGDRVWYDGRWRAPGAHGEWVFPARTAVMAPDLRPAEGGGYGAAQEVLDILLTWNWQRQELDARLLLGWICAAMIGGALDWRPMTFLTGDQATGKSTLQALIKHLLGGLLVQSTNTTAAGIYQKVQHDSAPVSVDEIEAEADTRRADDVIKLARVAASGGLLLRGGSDHNGKEFQARSAFIFSAINMPPMGMQDQSRMAVLALRPLDEHPSRAGKKDLASITPPLPSDPRALGRQLLRRMFDGWERWPRVLSLYRGAMREAGHGGRGADQFGTMAAAAHLALSDDDPTSQELDWWIDRLKVDELAETATFSPNWKQCLQHMLDTQPDALRHRSGAKSVGAAVEAYRRTNSDEDLADVCKAVGLAVTWPDSEVRSWETVRLFVPATHPAVQKLFEGTQWAGRAGASGVWASALRQAPEDAAQPGACGKGLDKKRWGIFIALGKVYERE